jgi:hypothetical protein
MDGCIRNATAKAASDPHLFPSDEKDMLVVVRAESHRTATAVAIGIGVGGAVGLPKKSDRKKTQTPRARVRDVQHRGGLRTVRIRNC